MKLTEHFTLEELTHSNTADRLHIDNKPNKKQISELKRLCETVLEPIRIKYNQPIIVTSGYRCPKLNAAINGASNSQHVTCTAADIKPKYGSVKNLFDFIVDMIDSDEIEVRQLIDEHNYTWIHISINDRYHGYRKNQILHLK